MEGRKVKTLARLIASVAICQIAGIMGSLFTAPAISTWYAHLRKPDLAPPNWVFAPVWTTLYLLMGIALFLIWNGGFERSIVRKSVSVFSVQLGLNVLWSYLFFELRSPALGLAGIIVLWATIVFTIALFFRLSKTSSLLLVPYLLWVTLAGYLNYMLFILNA
ncbi:MAG: TspO/MBR family protein [archaeon]